MKRIRRLFQSIHFKIPIQIIIILLIAFQFVGVYFVNQYESRTLKNYQDQIDTQVEFLVNNVTPILEERLSETDERARLTQVIDTFSNSNLTRIQIINTKDGIIASNNALDQSEALAKTNDNNVREALVSQRSSKFSEYDVNNKRHTYTTIKPILSQSNNTVVGAVRVTANMNRVYEQTQSVMSVFIQSAVIAIVGSFILALVLSQGLTLPIENMRQQALRISEGIYNYPAKIFGNDELGELAKTLNELSVKVKDSQELIESERQRLDGILRYMTDGVIATDRRGNVLLVNERALQLLGIDQQSAIGISIIRLLRLKDQYTLTDLLGDDREILMDWVDHGEYSILKGEFSVIRRETGFVTGVVCVLTDVTEQEKTEQERRDFVSNVSHELRTPLTSIKSYTEALREGAWQDQVIAPQFLNVIQLETDRMMRMIGNLLDLSKIHEGQYKLNLEYIDFKRMVSHILDRFEFMLEQNPDQKKFKLTRDFTSREIYLEIDQDRVTQVIDNILNNAIKYSPDGGVIVVKIEDSHSHVHLSIKDQGLGIPQKDIPHLFQRFYRVDKARSREQGGTGLGLAISKEIIELHGGKIWATSVEGKGSTFGFDLPYLQMDFDDEGWDD